MFDFLSVKLKIFYDLCSKVGITEDGYHDAVSTMLSGRANKWYYNNLATKGLTFKEMCKRLRTHFETEENRQHYMDMWRGYHTGRQSTRTQGRICKNAFKSSSMTCKRFNQALRPNVRQTLSFVIKLSRPAEELKNAACAWPSHLKHLNQYAQTFDQQSARNEM